MKGTTMLPIEQLEKLTLAHKELTEAHEVSKAALLDAESKLAAHVAEIAKLKADHVAAIEASEKAKSDALAKVSEIHDKHEKLQSEFDALKAKMELTPALNDVTDGSKEAIEASGEGADKVDHAKEYVKLLAIPGIEGAKACAKYRELHGKELGLK